MRTLGILFTEIGADFVRGTMPVDGRTRQPYGLLHGGASVALAETLGSMGAYMCVDPSRYLCVGQEINANHVTCGAGGPWSRARRERVHLGGRSQVWSIDIVNESGKRSSAFRASPWRSSSAVPTRLECALAFGTPKAYRSRHEQTPPLLFARL